MIVDAFTFFNEYDLLEARLIELYPVVDQFIIVEADQTFRGNPKPYYFDHQLDRFARWLDKITVVHFNMDAVELDNNLHTDSWTREYAQRNAIASAYDAHSSNDTVLISDVDEIFRRETIAAINPADIMAVHMNMFYYGINIKANQGWSARAVRGNVFDEWSPQEIRIGAPVSESVDNGGWHFSYLMDAEGVSNKLGAFAHWELDTPENRNLFNVKDRMARLTDPWGGGNQYDRVDVDDTWPVAMRENKEYWSKYIL